MERREHPRFAAGTAVRIYRHGQGFLKAVLIDFSQGGVSVRLVEVLEEIEALLDEQVHVMADHMDTPFCMQIIRCGKNELGLRFLE